MSIVHAASSEPLEPGARLTADEFMRRYEAMPSVKKAELIEGIVYMPSPVRLRKHGNPHFRLTCWLGYYEAHTPGVIGADNTTIRLDGDNVPQPDDMLMVDPASGGQSSISADDYAVKGPEFVAEVAASSVGFDLHTKKAVYRRNNVREYLVWRVLDRQVDWFVSRDSEFEPLVPDAAGILRSEFFPGLWLDEGALIRGDMTKVLAVLQQGLDTAAHAHFVEQLKPAGRQDS
jgi:Uma2 family endonuclease